jgi:hypothetical protein
MIYIMKDCPHQPGSIVYFIVGSTLRVGEVEQLRVKVDSIDESITWKIRSLPKIDGMHYFYVREPKHIAVDLMSLEPYLDDIVQKTLLDRLKGDEK